MFSSATRPLYAQDVLQSVALPTGSTQHFRYRKQHVADELWELLESNASPRLEAARVTVVFVDQAAEEGASPTVTALIPIRRGVVLRAYSDGEFAHFHFRLTNFNLPTNATSATSDVQSSVPAELRPPEKYASLIKAAPATAWTEDANAYQQLATVLASSAFAPDRTVFAGFYGIRELRVSSDRIGRAVQPRTQRQPPEVVYSLDEGRSYALDVSFTVPAGTLSQSVGPVELLATFDRDWLSSLGRPGVAISGAYDRQLIPFSVRPTRREGYAAVDVSFAQATANDGFQAPSWSLLVEVRRRWWRGPHLWLYLLTEALSYSGTTALGVLIAVNRDDVWSDARWWVVAAAAVAVVGIVGRVLLSSTSQD